MAAQLQESYNVTYFFETLPAEFDEWNLNQRVTYFSTWLLGYADLPQFLQNWILEKLYFADLQLLYEAAVEIVDEDVLSQPNATEIIFKYMYGVFQHESDITTTTTLPQWLCDSEDIIHSYSLKLFIVPAVLLIMILMFIPKRKQLCPSCCWSRPAIIVPVDFINDRTHRLQYACMFAVMAFRAITLFDGSYFWKPSQYDDEEFMKTWGWTKVFMVWLNIILLGLCVYPMLVFISKAKYILCNIAGAIGALTWSTEDILIAYGCIAENEWSYDALQLTVQAPIILIYCILFVTFCYDLILNIKAHCDQTVEEEESEYTKDQKESMEYLEELLKRKELDEPDTIQEKAKRQLIYKKLKGYRYSPRIVCTMVLGLMCLYQLMVYIGAYARFWSQELLHSKPWVEEILDDLNLTVEYDIVHDHIQALRYGAEISCYGSVAIQLLLMIHAVICYRHHVCLTYKGDRSWYGDREIAPANILVSGMRYSGYQIAYLLYGFLILFFVIYIVILILSYLIIIPLIHGYTTFVIEKIKELWPTVIIGLALYHGQVLLAKFAFLQDRGAVLALTNRRAYHVMSFFLFFLNIVLGLFSCLRRILISLVLGVILVSRLDRCLLMKGFEGFDAGFTSYVCMVRSDIQHNHPLMKGFIYILQEAVEKRKALNHDLADVSDVSLSVESGVVKITGLDSETSTEDNLLQHNDCENSHQNGLQNGYPNGHTSEKLTPKLKEPLKMRNKWWKAITMYNNPSIVLERLQNRVEEAKKQQNMNDRSEAVDAVVSAGTVLVKDDSKPEIQEIVVATF